MKKIFLLISLLLSLCTFSKGQKNDPQETEDEKFDSPDIANERDFEMTKDPALGYPPSERMQAVRDIIGQSQTGLVGLGPLNWQERGPSSYGGRTRAIMFDPNDGVNGYKKVWAGGVSGGLWYTQDIAQSGASLNWIHVSDFWDNLAISCITFDPRTSHTNEFYVGTGEGWFNLDAVRGGGIWKTSDGGTNWAPLASTVPIPGVNENFNFVQKIVVHPVTGDVYAATHSGIMRSQDGGLNWTRVFGTFTTKIADLEISAAPTYKIFASSGIHGTDGIYHSTNGTSWTPTTNGLPTSNIGRIELACAPSNDMVAYAMIAHHQNFVSRYLEGVYKTSDGGTTWTTCTLPMWQDASGCGTLSSDMTRGQAHYDLIAQVDPVDENMVLIGGIDLLKSNNAGLSWSQLTSWFGGCGYPYVHADQHGILFQPNSQNILYSNDGGVFFYENSTGIYENKSFGYNITQFYSCALNPSGTVIGADPNNFLGGTQDNGTIKFDSPGINAGTVVFGGDGMLCFIDQEDPNYQVNSTPYARYYRTTDNWATSNNIANNGICPIYFVNPADYDSPSDVLFFAAGHNALASPCQGAISFITDVVSSPSIENKLSNITGFSGLTSIGSTTFIKVAHHLVGTPANLYVGTNYGELFKIPDVLSASPVATNIIQGLMPNNTTVSCIEFGATEDQILITFSNYGVTSVWETLDGGANWFSKEGDLPDMPVRYALYNPNNFTGVLLATESGVWTTEDITETSVHWTINPNEGLSKVRIDMLKTRAYDNLVVAATHGRGMFSSQCVFSQPVSKIITACPSGNTVDFSDGSSNTINPTYLWDFGDGNTSVLMNPSHTYSVAGIYTATLTVTNYPSGCFESTSVMVTTTGSIIHLGSTTLNTTELYMADGSTIEVQSGDILDITNGSFLHACNAGWNGIVVQSEGTLNMGASRIEDALNAIEMQDGSILSITGNTFDKNVVDIFAHDGYFASAIITGNIFKYSPLLAFDEAQPFTHISLDNVSYINIGGGSVINDQNQFENKENGIFASKSTLNCFNNKFFNIGRNEQEEPGIVFKRGAGIHAVSKIANTNSLLVSENSGNSLPNKFITCNTGIITSGLNNISILKNNKSSAIDGGFESCIADIHMDNFENAFADIKENEFLDFARGVDAYGLSLGATLIIKGNWFNYLLHTVPLFYNYPLSAGNLRYGYSAINIQADRFSPVNMTMYENKISNSAIGIHLRNIQSFHGAPTVYIGDPNLSSGNFSNRVNYVDVPLNVLQSSSPPNIGFWFENGDNLSINNNQAKSSPDDPILGIERTFRGFSVDNITNSRFCSNKAEKTGSGVWVYNMCSGTEFHGTTNTNCFHSFHLINVDLLDQGDAVNSWDNVWNRLPANTNDIVGSTNGTQFSWYHPTGSPVGDPTNPYIFIFNVLPGISSNTSPDCSAPPIPAEEKRNEMFGAAVSDTSEYDNFPEENRYLDKEEFYRTANEDPSILILGLPDDSLFLEVFDSLQNTNVAILSNVADAFSNGEMQLANSMNQSITALQLIENNSKTANNIYYLYRTDSMHELDSAYIVQANFIADQNAIEGGLAVYIMRAILKKDILDDPVGYYRKAGDAKINEKKYFVGRMYPNPARDFITYAYLLNEESADLHITDALGKSIRLIKLYGNRRVMSISTSDLVSGVYFYNVSNTEIKQQGRFTIIR